MIADERGSVMLGVALVWFILLFMAAIGVAGMVVAAHATAATAADAAALGAAPVTFLPFGASGTPSEEAARIARANGAVLVSCRCEIDGSWESRTVEVTVARIVPLPVVGSVTVAATSRASFDPSKLVSR